MSNIYNIKQDLLSLFDEIDENEGEITEEQEHLLAIKQEELNIRLADYHKAITSWNADITACKEEEKRIATVRKKHENRIKRLKKVMLDAVIQFGDEGKSGNKFIELSTLRLYTKGTEKVEVDEERINILIELFVSYINKLSSCGMLYLDEDVDLTIICNNINNMLFEKYGPDVKPFSIADFTTIILDITSHMSIYDYFRKNANIINALAKDPINFKVLDNTPKENWKIAQKIGEENKTSVPTCAHIENNNSILFK